MINPSYFESLRREAIELSSLGLSLETVIPIALCAEKHPRLQRNQESGLWEPVLKRGLPVPAYVGKNPSFWHADGQPKLANHNNAASQEVLLSRIAIAERINRPLGIAIILSSEVVSIDFDTKNYRDIQELQDDLTALLEMYPVLRETRMERTPTGGVHIYVRVADGMTSWQRSSGGHFCNFTTEQGGPHRGEVLAGRRVSVCAPTRNGKGPYELINPQAGYWIKEVPDLASIGIFPQVKTTPVLPSRVLPAALRGPVPRLRALISNKAQHLLRGSRPYGPSKDAAADRSWQLTGFAKELYSWRNLLEQQGLSYEDDVGELLKQTISSLGIEEKADRVLESIDSSSCQHSRPEWALRRYRALLKVSSFIGADRDGFQKVTEDVVPTNGGEDPVDPAPLSREKCIDSLKVGIEQNLSPTALELLLGELADASGLHPLELRKLLAAVRIEAEQQDALRAEASAIQAQLARQQSKEPIPLEELFNPSLADALRQVTQHLPYCDHVVATTYLAGISGLVKLGTSICGNPYTEFVTPANLYVATVGRSGQKKTPLEKLLIRNPTRKVNLAIREENERMLEEWKRQCKECRRKAEWPPRPVEVCIHIQDYTGEALVSQLHVLDKRGLSMLVLRDELSGLFGMMNQYRSGKGSDEQQLLELFDGSPFSALRVAAINRSYERCQVSVYGAIQPSVLRNLVKGGDPSGKWARFLFSPLPERTQPLPTDVTDAGVAKVNAATKLLESYAQRIFDLPPEHYRLDSKAIALFSVYEHRKQAEAQSARLDAQRALCGKSAGKALRVAVLLHVLQHVVLQVPICLDVSETTLQLAIRLVDHLDDWALGFHEQAAADADGVSTLMRRIHALARNEACAVSWSHLREKMSSREKKHVDATQAQEAMRALERLGVGKVGEGPRGGITYRATADLCQ